MKKRLLGLLLVFALVLTSALPVFADYTKISDDADIQNAWERYVDLKAALEGNDVEALKAAYAAGEEANGALEWEDTEVLTAADEDFWEVTLTSQIVCNTEGFYSAFLADKNAKTALEFVEYYGMEDLEAYRETVVRFIPDIDAVFAEAQAMMPSEDILKVYDAYAGIQNALAFHSFDDDTRAAMEAMEAVLDIFNEMTEEDLAVLAQLLELENGEAAWNAVFSDWIDINILAEVDNRYRAFYDNPSEETAASFVEYYEAVFPENTEEAMIDPDLGRDFFWGIDDVYAEAQALLAGGGQDEGAPESTPEPTPESTPESTPELTPEPTPESTPEPTPEPESEKAPETGDANCLLPFAVVIAAGAAMIALRRAAQSDIWMSD